MKKQFKISAQRQWGKFIHYSMFSAFRAPYAAPESKKKDPVATEQMSVLSGVMVTKY